MSGVRSSHRPKAVSLSRLFLCPFLSTVFAIVYSLKKILKNRVKTSEFALKNTITSMNMKNVLFTIRQHSIFAGRIVLSFVSGGEKCLVCGNLTFVIPICRDCRKKRFLIDFKTANRCEKCGRHLVSERSVCMECRGEGVVHSANAVYPLFPYRLWNSELVRQWKLGGERALSPYFASLCAEALNELLALYENFSIVPVPPRPGKIKAVGWDQVEELAEFLEMRHGFSVLRVLERISVVEQKTLNRNERQASAEKSYRLLKNAPSLPKTICLIDDVITTGSTIESCAIALKKSGVQTVFALSLFSVGG